MTSTTGTTRSSSTGAAPDLGLEPDLERALAGLAPREREIIALRFGGELTGPEIAELTGLSLANVQQILSRSLRRMRAVIEEQRRRAGQAPRGPRPRALAAPISSSADPALA